MDRQRLLIIKWSIVVIVLLVPLLAVFEQMRVAWSCRNLIGNALFNDIRQYRLDHDGHYPPNIVSLALACSSFADTNRPVETLFLACPGAGRRLIAVTNAPKESDYIYINWGPFFGTNAVPKEYPLIYDRRLSNHYGLGVNVLTTTSCFFDFRARWLKKFAVDHPSYNIVIPE